MVLSNVRINFVEHLRITVASEGGDDMRIHAGAELLRNPCVPEHVLEVSSAELILQPIEPALYGGAGPATPAAIPEERAGGVQLHQALRDGHRLGRKVDHPDFVALADHCAAALFRVDVLSF